MKNIIKFSVVLIVLLLAKSSIVNGKECSTKLEWSSRVWSRITVSGNYIDVKLDVLWTSYTGYPKTTLTATGNNTTINLSSGRNNVTPGEYLIQLDCNSWVKSATAFITYDCSSNSERSNSDNSSPKKSNSGNSQTSTDNTSNNHSRSPQQGTNYSNSNYRLNRFWPSENVIRAELREFNYNRGYTSISEAKEILIFLGAEEISLSTSKYVSGKFGSGAEITIWPNTYDKANCYGIRFGKPLSGRPYFGSNDSYFEVCK
jgi:hypothetical protein